MGDTFGHKNDLFLSSLHRNSEEESDKEGRSSKHKKKKRKRRHDSDSEAERTPDGQRKARRVGGEEERAEGDGRRCHGDDGHRGHSPEKRRRVDDSADDSLDRRLGSSSQNHNGHAGKTADAELNRTRVRHTQPTALLRTLKTFCRK